MPRGNQLILVLMLLLIIGGAGGWLYYARQKKEYIPAAIALPKSALLVYQGHEPGKDFKDLQKNGFFAGFSSVAGVNSFASDFRFFDSLFQKEKVIGEVLKEQPLVVSVHATSAQRFQLLFLLQTNNKIDAGDVKTWAEKHWTGARIFQRNVAGRKIYDVKSAANEAFFSFSLIDNILALSRSTVLVEDAITAAGQNSINSLPLLSEMVKNTGESRLYFNFQTFPDLVSTYCEPSLISKMEGLKQVLDYGSYSWRLTDKNIKLMGSAHAQPENAFSLLLHQKPQQLNAAQVMPSSCAVLVMHGVDDFKAYFKKLTSLRKNSYETEMQELAAKKSISVEKEILPLLGNQWGYGVLDPGEEDAQAESYLAVSMQDTGAGWASWNALNDKAAPAGQAEFKGRKYRGSIIHKFSFPEILRWLYSDYAPEGEIYYTRINTFIVFGGNASAIERAIDAYTDKQTLASTSSYAEFARQSGTGLNFALYINPSRSQALALQSLRTEFKDKLKADMPNYMKTGFIGFTLVSSGDYFYSQVVLQKADSRPSGSEVAWSLSLEADAATKPYIVNNPDTHQKEILIQDINQNLYLINAAGKIVWKKDIEEPIVGEVYQLDLYRNNDLQYLFATTNKVYLLNRQGNPTGNYPIRLGVSTKTGVAMFDLANDRDYTYYVGTSNGRVYGFSGNGKPLTGWSPLTVDAALSMPVKYFNMQGKDYLFGVTDKGSLYIWSKEGKGVGKPIALNTRFRNPFKMQFGAGASQSFLVSVDTTGTLYTVSLDGKIQKKKYPSSGSPFFEYFDTDGNGKPEYILSGGTRIAAYEKDTTALWRMTLSEPLTLAPQVVSIGGQTFIVYTAPAANQLYLVDRNGLPYANFPTNGNSFVTVTDINGDGMTELIAPASGRLLYMYRLTQ